MYITFQYFIKFSISTSLKTSFKIQIFIRKFKKESLFLFVVRILQDKIICKQISEHSNDLSESTNEYAQFKTNLKSRVTERKIKNNKSVGTIHNN